MLEWLSSTCPRDSFSCWFLLSHLLFILRSSDLVYIYIIFSSFFPFSAHCSSRRLPHSIIWCSPCDGKCVCVCETGKRPPLWPIPSVPPGQRAAWALLIFSVGAQLCPAWYSEHIYLHVALTFSIFNQVFTELLPNARGVTAVASDTI